MVDVGTMPPWRAQSATMATGAAIPPWVMLVYALFLCVLVRLRAT
jgi:hypothetical protein